ncbi:MAG: hypothetical protein ABIB79_01325 [archaeon]
MKEETTDLTISSNNQTGRISFIKDFTEKGKRGHVYICSTPRFPSPRNMIKQDNPLYQDKGLLTDTYK